MPHVACVPRGVLFCPRLGARCHESALSGLTLSHVPSKIICQQLPPCALAPIGLHRLPPNTGYTRVQRHRLFCPMSGSRDPPPLLLGRRGANSLALWPAGVLCIHFMYVAASKILLWTLHDCKTPTATKSTPPPRPPHETRARKLGGVWGVSTEPPGLALAVNLSCRV